MERKEQDAREACIGRCSWRGWMRQLPCAIASASVSPALEGLLGPLTSNNRIRIWVDMTRRTDLLKPLIKPKPDFVTQTCDPNTQAEPGELPRVWTTGETASKQVNKCNKPLLFFCSANPGQELSISREVRNYSKYQGGRFWKQCLNNPCTSARTPKSEKQLLFPS